jgi:ubiquinone/menaquinone biosynthesis C-methylase UbiE
VRAMFGPWERQIAEAYRSIYVDMDSFVAHVFNWAPRAEKILEVGCGEGAVTQRLSACYPEADITAIDVSSRVGRLYRGTRDRVRFFQVSVQNVPGVQPFPFDLIILCDVLHHVPVASRLDLLTGIRRLLAPEGTLIFKDWQKRRTPIHWLSYASDRWLTGDRISYMTREEMRDLLDQVFGENSYIAEARIGPWWNNIAMLIRAA